MTGGLRPSGPSGAGGGFGHDRSPSAHPMAVRPRVRRWKRSEIIGGLTLGTADRPTEPDCGQMSFMSDSSGSSNAIAYRDHPHPRTEARLSHQDAGPAHTDWRRHHTGFNAWLATAITKGIGNMWAFYLFALAMGVWMAGVGEAVFGDPYPWALMLLIFGGILQMLLMIAILVGQQVLGSAADHRALQTYTDAEAVLHECREIQAHLKAQDAALTDLLEKVKGR